MCCTRFCSHGAIATMTLNAMQAISCDKQIAVIIAQCEQPLRPNEKTTLLSMRSEHCQFVITVRKRSCGKVMFLHLSVSNSMHRGVSASMHAGIHTLLGRHLPGQTHPWEDTPPAQCMLGYTTPCPVHAGIPPYPVHAGIDMATAADEMHSCSMVQVLVIIKMGIVVLCSVVVLVNCL